MARMARDIYLLRKRGTVRPYRQHHLLRKKKEEVLCFNFVKLCYKVLIKRLQTCVSTTKQLIVVIIDWRGETKSPHRIPSWWIHKPSVAIDFYY